jgi:futalosine hydrolase
MTDGPILVVAAVAPEIQGVLGRINCQNSRMIGGRSVHCGQLEGIPLNVVITGPGIVNTVQSITACVEYERPLLMIQAGCGGGFRQSGMAIGDIAVATTEVDVHLGIETGEHHAPLMELPFPIMESGGKAYKANYPLNADVVEEAFIRLRTVFGSTGIGVFKGPFITGSTVTGSEERADFLFKVFSPCMESMEGAAAAFLSHYYHLPFLEIRCASNMVGKRDLSQWNLSLACQRAGEAAADIIDFFIKEHHDYPVISGLFHLSQ